jgi:ABC-type multidrug transport system ATPase subunit
MAIAVSARGLGHGFSNGKLIFSNVSLELPVGDVLAVCGGHGVGKSVLLRTLAARLRPSAGELKLFGIPSMASILQRRIGWSLGTNEDFYSRLTGLENLIYFGANNGVSTSEVRERAVSWLAKLQMRGALDAPYSSCSTGMRQGLALCRAFLHNPDLIVLDDPFRGLSPTAVFAFEKLICDRPETAALVLSFHTENEARRWTSNIVRLTNHDLPVEISAHR